jgi:hypothetical protein
VVAGIELAAGWGEEVPKMQRAAGLTVVALLAAAMPARAGEPADRGISMTAWAGAAVDRSVFHAGSGEPLHEGAPLVGATALGNIRSLALGGAVDATPGIDGDRRLAIAALLGYAPEANRWRFQFLGEVGRRRFSDVGGNLLAHQVGSDTWLPYVGLRLGVARTVPAHGMFEVGASLFGRYDVGRVTVTNVSSLLEETRTDYRVGGWMCGLGLQIGIRLEAADPRRTEEMMAAR